VNRAIAHIEQGLVEGTLHMIALYKPIAQFGIAVAAFVVDGINALRQFKDSDIMVLRRHSKAYAFKQISLCGHVNPVVHD
jgi:hypothetical protein